VIDPYLRDYPCDDPLCEFYRPQSSHLNAEGNLVACAPKCTLGFSKLFVPYSDEDYAAARAAVENLDLGRLTR
jgi:hypothetical protein